MRDHKGRELPSRDLTLADGAFEAGIGIFEDVVLVIVIIVVVLVIAFDNCASKSSRKEEEGCCEGDQMHCK